jgi:two-component system, chemotaxis family, sensor kinase CheA
MNNNAIDHGIGPPNERKASEKFEEVLIVMSAEHVEKSVIVSIRDASVGINTDKVCETHISSHEFH